MQSSTQISDNNANIIQHLEYLPYGESFYERRDVWNTPYKFNAKELDEETGMYYYGARYYTPEVSIWLSVDPLADKYPSMSPFMYCAGNPVIFIDPDGKKVKYPKTSSRSSVGNYLRVLYDRVTDSHFRREHRARRKDREVTHYYKDLPNVNYSRPKDVESVPSDGIRNTNYIRYNTRTKSKFQQTRPTDLSPPPGVDPLIDPLPNNVSKANVSNDPCRLRIKIRYDADNIASDDISIIDNNTGNTIATWTGLIGKGVIRTTINLNSIGSNNLSIRTSQNSSSITTRTSSIQQSSIKLKVKAKVLLYP